MECYTDMPKISYLTALDFYMVTCYGFVVFSILEFAVVHQDKFNYKDFESKLLELSKSEQKSKDGLEKRKCFSFISGNSNKSYQRKANEKVAKRLVQKSSSIFSLKYEKPNVTVALKQESIKSDENDFKALYRYSVKISKIDHVAKVAFPILFVLFNTVYFFFHMYKRKIF